MSSISFFIPCHPPTVTAQQKGAFAMKGGGVRFFTKAKVRAAENTLHALLYPYRPATPLSGPLMLVVRIGFPWRKSELKSRIRDYAEYPMETRPDCSNLIKLIEDVMGTLGYWRDDGQNASLFIHKYYTDRPGIGINLAPAHATRRDGSKHQLI